MPSPTAVSVALTRNRDVARGRFGKVYDGLIVLILLLRLTDRRGRTASRRKEPSPAAWRQEGQESQTQRATRQPAPEQ